MSGEGKTGRRLEEGVGVKVVVFIPFLPSLFSVCPAVSSRSCIARSELSLGDTEVLLFLLIFCQSQEKAINSRNYGNIFMCILHLNNYILCNNLRNSIAYNILYDKFIDSLVIAR